MDRAQLLTSSKAIIQAIAPELQKLYVVDAEHFRDLPCNRCEALGWADRGSFFDHHLADRIPDFDGPRDLIVLDLEAIEQAAAPGGLERCVAGVAIHEAGHCVPVTEVMAIPDTPRVRELQLSRMAGASSLPDYTPDDHYDPHGMEFVRYTTHLLFRALVAGYSLATTSLYGPYGWLSNAETYLTILTKECHEMVGETFRTIRDTPPPEMFTQQWEMNLAIYKRDFARKAQ